MSISSAENEIVNAKHTTLLLRAVFCVLVFRNWIGNGMGLVIENMQLKKRFRHSLGFGHSESLLDWSIRTKFNLPKLTGSDS